MSAAKALATVADAAHAAALRSSHQRDPGRPYACVPWCERCRLEAKARLFGRCEQSAKAIGA